MGSFGENGFGQQRGGVDRFDGESVVGELTSRPYSSSYVAWARWDWVGGKAVVIESGGDCFTASPWLRTNVAM